MSSRTIHSNFLYVSLVALIVFALLFILGLSVGNDLFTMVLVLIVGVFAVLVVFGVMALLKRRMNG